MGIPFHKYSATGNDFVLIDDRDGLFPVENRELLQKICARRTGVGADGIILLQTSEKYDFRMRHFNPDAGEAEMCGNGARSLIRFAFRLGLIEDKTRFESMFFVHEGRIDNGEIKIKMNTPRNLEPRKEAGAPSGFEAGGYVEIGVPHYVLFLEDVQSLDVAQLGSGFAHHPVFPKGTNVDFVEIQNEHELKMRTFERGVEAETLSCGTGATAGAIIANLLGKVTAPVTVQVPGGTLKIDFDTEYENIWLSGPVDEIYRGELLL